MTLLRPLRWRLATATVATAATLAAAPARAHDAWVVADGDGSRATVVFGHAGELAAFDAAKVRSLVALDAAGQPLPLQRRAAADGAYAVAAPRAAMWMLSFDNGYWSKAPGSPTSENRPRTEVPGATTGTHAVKYGKTIVAWSPAVRQPQRQRFEIVPLTATPPTAGATLPVQVWWDGRPLAGAKLVRDGAPAGTPPVVANADGRADVPVVAGTQRIVVAHRVELRDEPRADVLSAAANLVYTAR